MNLIIRADASSQMGTGHVMRCLALAQAWQDSKGQVTLVVAGEVPELEKRWRAEGMEVVRLFVLPGGAEDALQTGRLARSQRSEWVVVDGYHFGAHYQRILKERGLRLLVIDDKGHAAHYYADIVLNQNIHAEPELYTHKEPYTRILLGPQYVLLRREFMPWRGWKRVVADVAGKILITLGGADPQNFSANIITTLHELDHSSMEIVLIIGAANAHYDHNIHLIKKMNLPVKLLRSVSNMSELMSWADVAISSGGTTVWELAFMGVPSLVGRIAPVEDLLIQGLNKYNLFNDIGWFDEIPIAQLSELINLFIYNKERRKEVAVLGPKIVDGNGCNRVLDKMFKYDWDYQVSSGPNN